MRLSSFERYQEFVAQEKLPESYEVIDGAHLMYFGERSAKTLIIMIPGMHVVIFQILVDNPISNMMLRGRSSYAHESMARPIYLSELQEPSSHRE